MPRALIGEEGGQPSVQRPLGESAAEGDPVVHGAGLEVNGSGWQDQVIVIGQVEGAAPEHVLVDLARGSQDRGCCRPDRRMRPAAQRDPRRSPQARVRVGEPAEAVEQRRSRGCSLTYRTPRVAPATFPGICPALCGLWVIYAPIVRKPARRVRCPPNGRMTGLLPAPAPGRWAAFLLSAARPDGVSPGDPVVSYWGAPGKEGSAPYAISVIDAVVLPHDAVHIRTCRMAAVPAAYCSGYK